MLIASATWRMPSSATRCECRRVWRSTPLRASSRITAQSAVDAPVTMLRVYCSCPGVSATMKWRRGGREVAVRDVDRDALLALGREPVEQQREVELAVDRAVAPRVGLERRELVVEDQPGLEQQAPDQRGLAVVDRAARDEAQQALLAQRAQKYPSCFFFSIEAAASWSITRPWRSEVRDARISSTISATVVAELSTAPVSG